MFMGILGLNCVILLLPHLSLEYSSPYDDAVNEVTEEEIESYLSTICLDLGNHICLTAVGRCSQCGGMTPCCNMKICNSCASARGVCPFCLKKVDWTKNTNPEKEIPLLLAVLSKRENIKERRVAIHALTQIKEPKTLDFMMRYKDEKMLSKELAGALGAFNDERYISFLEKTLHDNSGDSYFGEDDLDTETRYYLSTSAEQAAQSLAKIGSRKAADILFNSAKEGKVWERVFAIKALAKLKDERTKKVLTECLKEFFKKDRNWKWIPGRDLIGATLKSLSVHGDRETALHIIHYIRNPGCDFLYSDLKSCLISTGYNVVDKLCMAIKEDLDNDKYDWGRLTLIEALGDIDNPDAIPCLIELLNRHYADRWSERDIKTAVINGLGKLQAEEALPEIERELYKGKEESVRHAAAHALGEIGGKKSFKILEEKLKTSDSDWIVKECLSSYNSIAFNEIKTDEAKLKAARLYVEKGKPDWAFQLVYQPVVNGEEWAVDLFFEILEKVNIRRNFFKITELLHSENRKVFDKTVDFFNELTGLDIELKFKSTEEKRVKTKEELRKWYIEEYR